MKELTEKFIQIAKEENVIPKEDFDLLNKFMNGESLE